MNQVALLLCGCLVACAPAAYEPPMLTSASVATHDDGGGQAARDRLLSLYGRAHAFDVEGRCVEAKAAYEQYAKAARASDPAGADMALSYAKTCQPHAAIDAALSNAIGAILARDPTRALALLDADTNDSPWVKYNRGVALADLHRVDDSARAFDAARDQFATQNALDGRSIAIYGKARAYHDALRCAEAWTAYQEYATLAGSAHPADAEMALSFARDCVKR